MCGQEQVEVAAEPRNQKAAQAARRGDEHDEGQADRQPRYGRREPGELRRERLGGAQARDCRIESVLRRLPRLHQAADLVAQVSLQFFEDLRRAAERFGQLTPPLGDPLFQISHVTLPIVFPGLPGRSATGPSAPPGLGRRRRSACSIGQPMQDRVQHSVRPFDRAGGQFAHALKDGVAVAIPFFQDGEHQRGRRRSHQLFRKLHAGNYTLQCYVLQEGCVLDTKAASRRDSCRRQARLLHSSGMDDVVPTSETVAIPDEATLLARMQAGEDDAFEACVRTYCSRLLAVTRRMLRNEEDAQDAVQEAFLAAFKQIGNFKGLSSFGTWLHRIAVNAALGRLRSLRRHPEQSIEDLLPHFGDGEHQIDPPARWKATSEAVLEQQESRALVTQCISELPDTYRIVLLLRDIEGLDTEETAGVLGTSPGVVKTRLHRARQALRSLLDPYFREGDV